MTKQEKIRVGIATIICQHFFQTDKQCGIHDHLASKKILEYLDSQGVVIRVDKKLPKDEVPCGVPCDKCITVEPLIGEK